MARFATPGIQEDEIAFTINGSEITNGVNIDINVSFVEVPLSETSPGVPGQMAMSPTDLYVCYAPNQWARFNKDNSTW